MIEIESLSKSYGDFDAVRELDLQIERGDIFGFIGPNGAGKTTTLRILATLLTPTRGNARIGGCDVVRDADMVRRIIGYLPDSFGVYEDMIVEEYLAFFAAAYGIRGKQDSRSILRWGRPCRV